MYVNILPKTVPQSTMVTTQTRDLLIASHCPTSGRNSLGWGGDGDNLFYRVTL